MSVNINKIMSLLRLPNIIQYEAVIAFNIIPDLAVLQLHMPSRK